jgi:predicted nucleotidyltransferase
MKRLDPDGYVRLFAPILEARPEVRFAWLYGSAARGEMNAESDIDVAVSLEPDTDDWEFRLWAMRELGGAARTDEVQVAVLEKAPLSLRATVVREGRLLMDRLPAERRTFERYTLLRWWDEAPRARWTARMLTERLIAEGKRDGA